MDNYNYPMGADTPDAPWNRVDPEDMFGDAAQNRIEEEMNDRDGDFDEWLAENGYLPEEDEVEDSTYEKICELLAQDDVVYRKYYEHRKDAVIEDLQEEAASRREYEECEAYERERDE